MSNPEATRKTGDAIVVSLAPDFCKTPMGSSTPPVAYQIVANFKDSAAISPDVFMCGDPAFMLDESKITLVTGDEPGTAGGVKSGTHTSVAEPAMACQSCHVNKKKIVRHDHLFKMNNGNTQGRVVYQVNSCHFQPPGSGQDVKRDAP